MTPTFRGIDGGLFGDVSKADVGDVLTEFKKQGVRLMAWADPFFPDPITPENIRRAVAHEILTGAGVHYTPPVGNAQLKEVIAEKLRVKNKLNVEPQRQILITPGSDSGLLFAMMPFIGPGDEVLVPAPSYPGNFLNPSLLNGKAIPVPCGPTQGYHLDLDAFEAAVTSHTKMVLLTHPNNPTGIVFRRAELEALSCFVTRHNLTLVVDQAFEDFIYDDIEFVTPASLPGMAERTVTVFSVSKGMGLSGYRLGYVVADESVMDSLYGCSVNVIGATNSAVQTGVIEAFRHPEFMGEYQRKFERRRRLVQELFSDIPGVHMLLPESGFLSWLDVRALGTAREVVEYLIREARVSVNDGVPYGPGSEGFIRIVHGCFWSDDDALAALRDVRAALLKYRTREAR